MADQVMTEATGQAILAELRELRRTAPVKLDGRKIAAIVAAEEAKRRRQT